MYNDYNEVRAYLAHFGITGQKKGLRRFQSYQVAPTQSGMVGQEVGEAAKQRSRLSKEQKDKIKGAAKQIGKAVNSSMDKYTKAMNAKKERRQEAYYQHQQKKADYTLAGANSQAEYRDFYKTLTGWDDNDVDSAIIRNREEALNRLNKSSKYRGGYTKAVNKTKALANKLAKEYNVSYNDKKGKYSLSFKDPEKKRTSTAKLFAKSYAESYNANADKNAKLKEHYTNQSKIIDNKVKQLQQKYNDPTITARDITTSTAGGKYSYVLKDSKKKKYQNS